MTDADIRRIVREEVAKVIHDENMKQYDVNIAHNDAIVSVYFDRLKKTDASRKMV